MPLKPVSWNLSWHHLKVEGLISRSNWNISKTNTNLLSWNLASFAYPLPAFSHVSLPWPSSAGPCCQTQHCSASLDLSPITPQRGPPWLLLYGRFPTLISVPYHPALLSFTVPRLRTKKCDCRLIAICPVAWAACHIAHAQCMFVEWVNDWTEESVRTLRCKQVQTSKETSPFHGALPAESSCRPGLLMGLYKEKPRVAKGQVLWIFVGFESHGGKWFLNRCGNGRL